MHTRVFVLTHASSRISSMRASFILAITVLRDSFEISANSKFEVSARLWLSPQAFDVVAELDKITVSVVTAMITSKVIDFDHKSLF